MRDPVEWGKRALHIEIWENDSSGVSPALGRTPVSRWHSRGSPVGWGPCHGCRQGGSQQGWQQQEERPLQTGPVSLALGLGWGQEMWLLWGCLPRGMWDLGFAHPGWWSYPMRRALLPGEAPLGAGCLGPARAPSRPSLAWCGCPRPSG